MTNSRQKGARGERLFRDLLRKHGYEARRGQQFAGRARSGEAVPGEEVAAPDVIHTVPNIHFEVKNTQRLLVWDYMHQAIDDAKSHETPVVAWKKNRHEWLVILRADDLLKIMREVG